MYHSLTPGWLVYILTSLHLQLYSLFSSWNPKYSIEYLLYEYSMLLIRQKKKGGVEGVQYIFVEVWLFRGFYPVIFYNPIEKEIET